MATHGDTPPRRLLLVLAAVTVATLAAVGALLFRTRSTVVEIEAELDHFELTLVPAGHQAGGSEGASGGDPAAAETVKLLAPTLRTLRLDLRGAGRVEAFLDGTGRSILKPGPDDAVRIASEEPFQPDLTTFGLTRVTLETGGRDRGGNRTLRLGLTPETPGSEAWSSTVPAAYGLTLEVRNASTGETRRSTVSAAAPDVAVTGGRDESIVGLALPGSEAAATLLRLVDPVTGEVSERRLPFATSEARALAWGDRLALIEPVPAGGAGGTGPVPLLRPDLKVVRPRFFRTDRFEEESFVTGGKVRFPGGEKVEVALEALTLLTLQSEEPFTLRHAVLREGRLAVVLWGRATSLRIGPTPELQSEELPSLFVWLYTHRLRTLVYSTVASILGLCMAFIKTFGLFKNPSS